jgi:uncharacterized LabA/DUF88 family protein
MMKAAILIDGGHLRVLARRAGYTYNPDFIEAFAHRCALVEETILRVLYYDCAPYRGAAKLPVSGEMKEFDGSDHWLCKLAERDLFAVRRGVLKFRGFKPRKIPVKNTPLTDDDFKPDFEQKGVDMRIGLDVATFAASRAADRIILVSADTDCIPAMKHGRKAGLQLILVRLPNCSLPPEMCQHADYVRPITWPSDHLAGSGDPARGRRVEGKR